MLIFASIFVMFCSLYCLVIVLKLMSPKRIAIMKEASALAGFLFFLASLLVGGILSDFLGEKLGKSFETYRVIKPDTFELAKVQGVGVFVAQNGTEYQYISYFGKSREESFLWETEESPKRSISVRQTDFGSSEGRLDVFYYRYKSFWIRWAFPDPTPSEEYVFWVPKDGLAKGKIIRPDPNPLVFVPEN